MQISKEIIKANGFHYEYIGDHYALDISDEPYTRINIYGKNTEIVGNALVEVICGEEMVRVRTSSVERINVILSLLKIKYRLYADKKTDD